MPSSDIKMKTMPPQRNREANNSHSRISRIQFYRELSISIMPRQALGTISLLLLNQIWHCPVDHETSVFSFTHQQATSHGVHAKRSLMQVLQTTQNRLALSAGIVRL
ncbi:hypothetical protein PoB_000505600 [Plakobranchus ocellatus]|uniref:Uncharacterized protein n=1 Tax=Plakobranchus ocellatus TaxID=259542 RepID=A0AAV3Y812_9GAST|nr:hypothetical protein PoB_000505600 [Plakobranchus ocellatus]